MKKLLFILLLVANFAQAQEVGFSRGNPSAKSIVLKAIHSAQKTLYLAAYQLTSADILKALVEAHNRGVIVAVVLDRTQAAGDSQAVLVASNIECNIDTKFRIMHHKFIVVDGTKVQTGSFNYSQNADKVNAENAILFDNQTMARTYKAQWDWLKVNTKPCIGGGQ